MGSMDQRTVPGTDELQDKLRRLQRRMVLWVLVVSAAGLGTCVALLSYGKQRGLYREHYEFRRHVRQGVAASEVIRRFGAPYRTYWTLRSVLPVLEGRGVYERFDWQPPSDDISEGWPSFHKILHYRTTFRHGEFVFVGADDRVLLVVTGFRRRDEEGWGGGRRPGVEPDSTPTNPQTLGREPDADDS